MEMVESTTNANVSDLEIQPQPDTQPFNSQILDVNAEQDKTPWGVLFRSPTNQFRLKFLALMNELYTFGRSIECDVMITEEHANKEFLTVISKVQFAIYKESLEGVDNVYLEDRSMNGTFVNQHKVGKGNKIVLNCGDKISLASPYNIAYEFSKGTADSNWIPLEMRQVYMIFTDLGRGAFGHVKLAKCKDREKLVAIKKIKKGENKARNVYNEVSILKALEHPCIVKMENVFDTSESLFIVLEYINGGDLASRIREVTKLKNPEAKALFYQLVLALEYLHSKGVAHRDLKPENILLKRRDEELLVKVGDFGLSKVVDTSTCLLRTACGTPLYTAPEVLMSQGTGTYTHKVDIWSLGVIMFQCISGKLPFNRERHNPVLDQIVRGHYSMKGPEWIGVCPKTKSVIQKMLLVDDSKRITIKQILKHRWLQDKDIILKVRKLLADATPCDENLNVQLPPAKRPRLEKEGDTIFRS